MSENTVIIINFCLYLTLSIIAATRKGKYSLVSVISYFYTTSALFSFLLYSHPLYDTTFTSDGTSTIEGCLYLFAINGLLITSFWNVDISNIKQLKGYNEKLFTNTQKVLCVLFIIYLIFSLPGSISRFFSGSNLADMRDEIYGNNASSNFFLVSLINRFFGSTPILLLCIASINILLLKSKRRIDRYTLYIYMALKINTIFATVTRQTMIFSLIEIVITLILFKDYLTARIKKNILKFSLIVVPSMYAIFSAITYARFGAQGLILDNLSTLRYVGEANLNFMNLMYDNIKQPFLGFSQFPLFRRILGIPYDDGTMRDGVTVFNTYIEQHYHYYNPTYIFHGLAGSLYSNFGEIGCVIVAIIINYFLRKKSALNTTFYLIIIVIMASYISKGIFYADYGFESGNLLIVYLMLLSYYLHHNRYTVKICQK